MVIMVCMKYELIRNVQVRLIVTCNFKLSIRGTFVYFVHVHIHYVCIGM